MEVSAEAKRIMVVALGKLYSSRTQRGGLRLHRSLLLTMVMKSARDIYHAAQATEESAEPGCDQQNSVEEEIPQPAEAQPGLQAPLPEQESTGSPTELRHDAQTRPGAENKENVDLNVPTQQSRKRRGKAAVEPDFLPCKKAKLEQGTSAQQIIVCSVLIDYVNCSSELGVSPSPIAPQRIIAAC